MIGSLGANEEKAFKFLLELDTTRGPHSTGVFIGVRTPTQFMTNKLIKSLGTPWDLYNKPEWKTALHGMNKVLIGHNRYATRGAVSELNAHPFEFGRVVGAHNGTIYNHHFFDPKRDFEVDSQAIYSHLDKGDTVATLENIHGPFALTWYDKIDETMNFVRNKDRPLHFVYTEDGKCMFWASESWMLAIALQKAHVKYKEIFQFAELVHYTFPIGGVSGAVLHKPRAVKIKEYVPPPVVHQGRKGGYGWWEDDEYIEYRSQHNRNRFRDAYFPQSRQAAALPAPATAPTQTPQTKLGGYGVGDIVAFTINKVVYPSANVGQDNAYIQAHVTGDSAQAVFLFPRTNSADWKLLAHVGFKFTGKIKRVNQRYLLIDLRSIEVDKRLRIIDVSEDDDDEDSTTAMYPIGSRGVKVDLTNFKGAVSKGCCVCGMPPPPEQASKLVWIFDDSDFICTGCQTTDIAKEYCSTSLKGGC